MLLTFAGQTIAGAQLESHQGLQLAGRRVYEEQTALRATQATYADRLGQSVTLEFTAAKQHATRKDAEVYWLQHPLEIMGQANALATIAGQTYAMGEAVLEVASAAPPVGQLTRFRYRLQAPQALLVDNVVVGAHIPSLAVLHAPSLGLVGGHIASAAVLYAQSFSEQLAGGHIASAAALYAPGLSASSNESLAGAHIASAAALYAPGLSAAANESLAGGHIASAAALHPPTLSQPFGGHGTLTDNLIRAYKLASLADETGTADLLNVAPNPTFAAALDGNGANYSGGGHDTGWAPSGSFSVSVWARPDNFLSDRVFGCNDGSNHRCYLGWNSFDEAFAGVGDAFSTSGSYTAAQWYHLVLTYDGATAKLFIDGVLRLSFAATFSGTSVDNFFLGNRNTAPTFAGLKDEAYFWARALTDGSPVLDAAASGEVADLYATGSGLFY